MTGIKAMPSLLILGCAAIMANGHLSRDIPVGCSVEVSGLRRAAIKAMEFRAHACSDETFSDLATFFSGRQMTHMYGLQWNSV